MKVEYINPFIESVNELFSTMLNAKATRGEIGICKGGGTAREIMALIGLSGEARGTVALSFPSGTALGMVSRLIGQETHVMDETVSDAVAEMVNIVAGAAKAKLSAGTGAPIELSLPTVVRGNSYTVDYPTKVVWLEVPFTSEFGPFSLRVTFETNGAQK